MDEKIDDGEVADDSIKSDEPTPPYIIILKWFLDPLTTCRNLGIEPKLESEEWLPLRQFPFGEVGYDFERELMWYIRVDHAEEASKFIKNLFEVNHISYGMSDAMSGVLAKQSIPSRVQVLVISISKAVKQLK